LIGRPRVERSAALPSFRNGHTSGVSAGWRGAAARRRFHSGIKGIPEVLMVILDNWFTLIGAFTK
jgi:hypothetical protein